MSKIIIFEGVDKAGKSTTAEAIAKILGCPILKGLAAKTPQELYDAGHELLANVEKSAEENAVTIVDRMHVFSEPIYNRHLGEGGEYEASTKEYYKVLDSLESRLTDLCKKHSVYVYIFTAEPGEILKRMQQDGGPADALEAQVKENVTRYIDMYENLYSLFVADALKPLSTVVKRACAVLAAGDVKKIAENIIESFDEYYIKRDRAEKLYFAPIVPKKFKVDSPFALVLSQNIQKDPEQIEYWKNFKGYKVLDNGAFELGKPSGSIGELLNLATEIGANELVLPDVFRDDSQTIICTLTALKVVNAYRGANLLSKMRVMAVPQGETLDAWLQCYKTFLAHPDIDVIAINRDSAKFFGCRVALLKYLEDRGLVKNTKQYHLLGMQDDIKEIQIVAEQYPWVRSIDSCFPYILSKHLVENQDLVRESVLSGFPRSGIKETIDFESDTADEVKNEFEAVKKIIQSWNVNI